MDEHGAEFSEAGIPVKTASDDQKVLDTRWVTLDIANEPTYNQTLTLATNAPGDGTTLGFTTEYLIIYTHNLGFLPAFDYEIASYSISDITALFTPKIVADATNIYLVPEIGSINTSVDFMVAINLRVYTLPITTEYQAPIVNSQPLTASSPSGYGVEFLKPNVTVGDITEASPDQYSFSTALRPLNILQHGTVTIPGISGNIVINYNYGQHPFYLLGVYYPDSFTSVGSITIPGPLVEALAFAGGRGAITSTTITVSGIQSTLSGSFAYILFKDPMDLGI